MCPTLFSSTLSLPVDSKYDRSNAVPSFLKQKLTALGADFLPDALLNLAVHSDEADDLIEQLITTPRKNVQRFKKKLSGLKRRKRFIGWRESASFAREIEMLLQDLKSGVDDPLTGVELVAAFYEADSTVFEMCDDSSGNIGDVFRYDAKELFLDYASRCSDKDKNCRTSFSR